MHRPLLLAFAGGQGVGKTSLATYAKDHYGGQILSFATPLKVELYDVSKSAFGRFYIGEEAFTLSVPEGDHPNNVAEAAKLAWVNKHKADLRYALQRLGDYRRLYKPSYFVEKLLLRIEELVNFCGHEQLYVDDCRFENEVRALADVGFHIVKVECDVEIAATRSKARDGSYDPNTRTHKSETETTYLPYNYTIDNSGLFERSTAQVDDIVTQIRCAD